MLILDTDHLTAIDRASEAGVRLQKRLEGQPVQACTTIISISEQLRGLMALIASARIDPAVVEGYGRLGRKLDRLHEYRILHWTFDAAAVFKRLERDKVRVGTMDLRIASIVMANNATLLSRNLRDFQRVPGLRVEDWL